MAHQGPDSGSDLPGWLSASSDTLREFARDPSGFVIGIVATWIVGGILLIGRTVVESLLLAFDSVVVALDQATAGLVGALDAAGAPVLEAAAGASAFYVGLVSPLGPLAPVVTVGGIVVVMVLMYRAAKAALMEVPLLGAFLEFLGVDL